MNTFVERRGGRVYVRPQARRLAHDTTARLLPRPGEVSGRPVELDLRNIEFVEPFGLIYLYMYVRQLLHYGAERVDIRIPRGEVNTYLTRMGVRNLLEEDQRIRVRPALFIRHRDLRDRLIELTPYEVEVEDDADDLAARLLDLIRSRRGDLGMLAEPLHLTFTELISNVIVHSGRKQVLVAAQSYGERVCIAIADEGIGIPGRLRQLSPSAEDHHLIEMALEPNVSTRVGRGGMGLTMLSEQIREYGRHLAIRSGEGHVVVGHQGRDRAGRCRALPGTIIEAAW